MTRFRRIALLSVGVLLVTVACCALLYAFAPLPRESESVRPAPTLFAPP
ncbi:MAG: hypothetical protein ACT4QE_20090 [Anaerolineales bacterium]